VAKRWRYDGDNWFPTFKGPGDLERHLFDDYEAVLALLTHSPTVKLSPPFNIQPVQTLIPSMPPSMQISVIEENATTNVFHSHSFDWFYVSSCTYAGNPGLWSHSLYH